MDELTWPQSFELQGPQGRSYGFAVTQPGALVVSVQAEGPVSVAVHGPLPNPLPQPVPQSTPGLLRFTYQLSAQDVQRGIFWYVEVRLASNLALQPGARARGTITVQSTPVNHALVQQAAQARLAQRHTSTPQERAQYLAQTRAQLNAAFTARKTQLDAHLAQRRTAVLQQLQPALDDMRRQKAAIAGPAPQGSDQLHSRGLLPTVRLPPSPPPPPSITAVSIANNQDTIPLSAGTYGQPGDEVTLSGKNFGSADGEVHFVIGPLPSQDLVVPANNLIWLDTRIMAPVPQVSGALPYAGVLYVKRLSDGAKSATVPFQFEPNVEQREIRILSDFILDPHACCYSMVLDHTGAPAGGGDFFGGTSLQVLTPLSSGFDVYHDNSGSLFADSHGVDHFFINTRLKNGWKMAQMPFTYTPSGGGVNGSTFATSTAVGTDILSTYVGFTENPGFSIGSYLDYGVVIPIQGPAQVPDGLVCVNPPAPGSQCPQTDFLPP
jgi:hypothetical protein